MDLLNERSLIKCLEDAQQQVQLPGLTEHLIRSADELLELMAKAHALRSTGTTSVNLESSRSHQILQLSIKERKEIAFNDAQLRRLSMGKNGQRFNNRTETIEVEVCLAPQYVFVLIYYISFFILVL